MNKKRKIKRKNIIFIMILIIFIFSIFLLKNKFFFVTNNEKKNQSNEVTEKKEEKKTDKKHKSEVRDGITFIDDILLVNKQHSLPNDYSPGEDPTASNKISLLIRDMQEKGFDINDSCSGYRSYGRQSTLYNNYVREHGVQKADTFSARPGYSEHQTGLAFDLKHEDGSLISKQKEIDWVKKNAHKYGFIVRYPEGKEHITGYQYEPWHLRFIGERAKEIFQSGKTLEEFLGVEGGTKYLNQ